MHVIFISACQKRAIRRSHAILDSYDMRAGEHCWISPMTTEGLQKGKICFSSPPALTA